MIDWKPMSELVVESGKWILIIIARDWKAGHPFVPLAVVWDVNRGGWFTGDETPLPESSFADFTHFAEINYPQHAKTSH